ncbi:MAG: hypothetical protein U0V75_01940 [Ferruginibacter sp.]
MMKTVILFLLAAFTGTDVWAQPDTVKVPIERQLRHDKINEEQKLLDKADGRLDGLVKVSSSEEINLAVTDALLRRADAIQSGIERNKKIPSNNEKVRYLNYLENLLRSFRTDWRTRKINALYAPQLMDNFEKIMTATIDSTSMVPLVEAMPYEIAKINTAIFVNNPGYRQSVNIVYLKYCALNPDKILGTLSPFVRELYADSLLVAVAKTDPGQLYKYSQDTYSPVGKLIHNNTNGYVKTIAQLSNTPGPLLYFPFLDDIVSGKKQIDSLRKIIGDGEKGYDSVRYYKLLVQTEIEYSKRLSKGDTAVAMFGANGLRDMLRRKALQHFVTPINELHERPENIRMRAVEPLSPAELYYMIVTSESEIYTSSYKHSFNRMLQRLGKKPATDSLLMGVNYDYFKKFIKMAANFNKLDTFLNLMPAANAESLMKSFVANLEKSGTLEDAVDVADSYSSISNKNLQANVLNYVAQNEKRCSDENSKRGKIIYSLLNTIFLSADTTKNIDLSAELGIPPIYTLDNKLLTDDSGRIVQQVFFYGDDDGKKFFPSYIAAFSSKEWKIDNSNPEWVSIRSLAGPKIWIYVNRPLNNDKNLDDTAQVHLNNYLRKNDITPTIITHRGHSYWLPRTIDRMPGDAKIILLGSCGGYKNLSQLIEQNPDAHIISTKQIGTGNINQFVTNSLNQNLLANKPIVWKSFWNSISSSFAKQPKDIKEAWDDYVPPYKNLGAIFLKAYNKKAEAE